MEVSATMRRVSLIRLTASALLLAASVVPMAGVSAQAEPTARDGQRLSGQSPETQGMFTAVWGSNAATEWVNEHNAALGPAAPAPAPAAAPAPAPAPAPAAAPAAPAAAPAPGSTNSAAPGPIVTITDPTTNKNVPTSSDFTLRGTYNDPTAGAKAIDRVDVFLNGRREDPGTKGLGQANLDGNGGWSLGFSPTKFSSVNSNLYVYAHSTYSGKTTLATVNFNICDHCP
jgi:hypothetical protein